MSDFQREIDAYLARGGTVKTLPPQATLSPQFQEELNQMMDIGGASPILKPMPIKRETRLREEREKDRRKNTELAKIRAKRIREESPRLSVDSTTTGA